MPSVQVTTARLDLTASTDPLRPCRTFDEVYGLAESQHSPILYVGHTEGQSLPDRLQNHYLKASSGHPAAVHEWIRGLEVNGGLPIIVLLPFTTEQAAIDHFGLDNLLNERASTNGGSGRPVKWRFTPEEDNLLGTTPDREIARRLGCSPKTIARRRNKLGIPCYRVSC